MRQLISIAALAATCLLPVTAAAGPVYFTCSPAAEEGGTTTCDASQLLPAGSYPVDWYVSPSPGQTCDLTNPVSGGGNSYTADIGFGPLGNYEVCLKYTNGIQDLINATWLTASDSAPTFVWDDVAIGTPPVVGYPYQVLAELTEWSTPGCTVDFGDGSGAETGLVTYSYIDGVIKHWYCDSPAHTYTTAGNYTVTFGATESDGSLTASPYTQGVTVASAPYVYVDSLSVSFKSGRTLSYTGQVRVSGPEEIPVSKAIVSAEWYSLDTLGNADQFVAADEGTTNRSGIAKLTARLAAGKTYTLCVTNVTKTGWDYRSDLNVNTKRPHDGDPCAYVSVPPP